MKTIILTFAVAMLALSSFADGYISFSNDVSTRIYIYNYATLSANPVTFMQLGEQNGTSATGILELGLVWGSSPSSVNTLAANSFIDPATPGVINGDQYVPVSGTHPGETVYFQVFAWDSSFGNSLTGMENCLAAGGIFGAATGTPGVYGSIGAPLPFTLGLISPAPFVPIFGTSSGFFPGFTVMSAPAPEPATFKLAGLGAAALLLFRRRK